MKSKLSISKETNVSLSGDFDDMIFYVIIIATLGVIVFGLISVPADSIAEVASDKYDAQVALGENGSLALKALYSFLSNDNLIQLLLMAAFIILVIFGALKFINRK